jgi:mono/diheme cytochrome c family protein
MIARAACLALAATACVACGTARRGEPVAGPFASQDAKVLHGADVFDRHCDKCHNGGEAALGPSLNDKPLPQFLMKFQVRRGLGSMPGFSEEQISDDDLDALTEYIVALRHHGD